MNIEKRTEAIEQASNEIKSRAEIALYDVYMKGYHEGRHDYRNKVENCLVINPDCLEVLQRNAENPCNGCPNQTDKMLIGCSANPKECDAKQLQFVALDILKNFKQYESIRTDS